MSSNFFYIEATNYRPYGQLPRYWKEASHPLRRYVETISEMIANNQIEEATAFLQDHIKEGYWLNVWNNLFQANASNLLNSHAMFFE